jgi:hypothetical protein
VIHFSCCLLLMKNICGRFSTVSFCSDRKHYNVPRVEIISAWMHLVQSIMWWCAHVECFVDLLYLLVGNGKRYLFVGSTIALRVDFADRRDVGCCEIWNTWRQAGWFMSRWVHLIDLNKGKSAFWPSLHWE